jgi:hypothetical protein
MKIEILHFKGCPNLGSAIDVIRSVIPSAAIDEIEIRTIEEAERMRFRGSPTIRIDGVDIEPSARTRTDFGLSCRRYDGTGVPSRELVEAALAHDCCQRPPWERPGNLGFAVGAAAVAALASACCWVPLLLLAFGVSALGLSAMIESSRPWLFAGAVGLLVPGFYLAYGSSPGRSRTSKRLNRAAVWFAMACVLASAMLPLFAEMFVRSAVGVTCCSLEEMDGTTANQGSTSKAGDSKAVRPERMSALTDLSENFQELKDAFNADKNAVKVLLIVSPRCPMCRMGATTVQKQALEQIQSDKVKVFVVWIKRFFGDSRDAAQEAMSLVPDGRARHFWDSSGRLSKRYAKVVELPGKKTFAWDVYFVFGPKAVWSETPPAPDFWMHQLGGRDTGNMLDGRKFREAIARQLP